jgi:hypothetical protein
VKCQTFIDHPDLLIAPYKVQSQVAVSLFEHFVHIIGGATPIITAGNASDLLLLCKEFRFVELAERVSEFDPRLTAVQEPKTWTTLSPSSRSDSTISS